MYTNIKERKIELNTPYGFEWKLAHDESVVFACVTVI